MFLEIFFEMKIPIRNARKAEMKIVIIIAKIC